MKDLVKDCNDEIVCGSCGAIVAYYDSTWVDGSFEAICFQCKHPIVNLHKPLTSKNE